MNKPTLLHGIDGVLFGEYGGDVQLRPGVKSWLNWVHQHFDVVWFSARRPENIKALLTTLFSTENLEPNAPVHPFLCADWYDHESKISWLSSLVQKNPALEWYWIDDKIPTELPSGVSEWCCLHVNPVGEHELQSLRQRIELTILEYFR
jgi:hypothetical protein